MRHHALHAFAALAVVGLVLTAGCIGSQSDPGSGGYPNATWSSYQAGGRCVDEASQNGGWLYWGGTADGYEASFNATFQGVTAVNATLTHDASGVYTLDITPSTGTTKSGAPECTPSTTYGASADLPQDFTAFRVVYDGRTLAVARNDGETTAELVDLPTPINRTAST